MNVQCVFSMYSVNTGLHGQKSITTILVPIRILHTYKVRLTPQTRKSISTSTAEYTLYIQGKRFYAIMNRRCAGFNESTYYVSLYILFAHRLQMASTVRVIC